MNKKFTILCLFDKSKQGDWTRLTIEWKKYFNVDVIIDVPKSLTNYIGKRIDILFVDAKHAIANKIYSIFKKADKNFKNILVSNTPSPADVDRFKQLADRIIYTNISFDYLKWSTIASLRRFWNLYSKPSTIIYKNIIADFVEQKFTVDKKLISLTSKEIKLLKYFMNNRGKPIKKDAIFKYVWGYNTSDSTRTFDQMFFKLKTKIGKEYFHVKRNKGITFE